MAILLMIPASFASGDIATNQSQGISIDDNNMYGALDSNNALSEDSNTVYVDASVGSDDGNGTSESPVKTISQSLNLVKDKGTVYLIGSFAGEGNSNLTFGANPNEITFIGVNATIDGKCATSFAFVKNGTYTFKDIFFINNCKTGLDDQFGGVINNEAGDLTFDGCIFENNAVFALNNANGGAIDNSGNITLRDCVFKNNVANISNSSGFRKNTADGGAISNIGKLYIYNTAFIANKVLRNGGAIRTQDRGYAYISNCSFTDNIAAYHESGGSFGGAIYTWDCGITILDSIFKNNRVYDSSGYGAQGGAISSDRGNGIIDISGCQFINNTAGGTNAVSGQSIYIGGVTADIHYCTFDTSVYSISQSSDFNYNWWNVNDGNFKKLIENLPRSASVKTFADLKVSSDVEEIETAKQATIFVNLCWNGTDNQDNIGKIPLRTLTLNSNCGNLSSYGGDLVDGKFETTLAVNNTKNPLITAIVDDVVVTFDFTDSNTDFKLSATGCEIANGETAVVSISANENENGICLIDVGSGKYYAKLVNGQADVSIPNLNPGTYDVFINYLGNDNLGSYVANATVKVNDNGSGYPSNRQNTIILVSSTFTVPATDYGAGERGSQLSFTLKDSYGNVLADKTVLIALNCEICNVTTDKNGIGSFMVNLETAGVYTCAISFRGDEKYDAAPLAITKLTINKKKTTIKASAKTFKAKAKTKKISVVLNTIKNPNDGKSYLKKGKKLTLKVNGKTYTAKTNAKGIAKFTIKLTKKGKFAAKIKFAGDATYNASNKSIKITIK